MTKNLKKNQEKETKVRLNKNFLLLFLAVLSLGGFFLVNQGLLKRTVTQNKAEMSSPSPQKVKISNVNSKGFTVTWLTLEKAYGAIVYGNSREQIEGTSNVVSKKEDERSATKTFYTHSVKIDNLNPGIKYYFKIISGEKSYFKNVSDNWQESGIAEEITLPVLSGFSSGIPLSSTNSPGSFSTEVTAFDLCQSGQVSQPSCFRPNPIYGKIINHDGTKTEEALIFLEIPGKSNLLSSVTDNDNWVFDLANLLKSDLSKEFGYQPGLDLIKISANTNLYSSVIVYKTIPSVILNTPDITNPINLIVEKNTPTEVSPSNTPPSPTPIPTLTQIPTPALTKAPSFQGYLNFDIKLQTSPENSAKEALAKLYRQKSLYSTQKITLLSKNNLMQGKISVNPGEFNFLIKPYGYLNKKISGVSFEKGENKLDLTTYLFIPGDVNEDNKINILDLAVFFSSNKNNKGSVDFNMDKKNDLLDLSSIFNNYLLAGDLP